MSTEPSRRLIDHFLPPSGGFVLESLVSTTYQVDFEFFEEELLPAALGVSSPVSRLKVFRSELERRLQKCEVSVLYDLAGCERLTRLSPRIDAIPVSARKLHSKISLLMWVRENPSGDALPERRMRLLVGSANLTRQGFRHNYECVASLDFGGKNSFPRFLLTKAIGLVRQIAGGMEAPQLRRQLTALSAQAAVLVDAKGEADDSIALVNAEEVLPTIRNRWLTLSDKAPEIVSIISPFWPEGASASAALIRVYEALGSPARLDLICPGEKSQDGTSWLPVFDSGLARSLKSGISGQLFLRPTLPEAAIGDNGHSVKEIGDELEEHTFADRLGRESVNPAEISRALHAKIIVLDGVRGSVLYIGSSNCTRRGLNFGGPSNHEAGLVYQLTPRERKEASGLLSFAGPACQVYSHVAPATIQPAPFEEICVPRFLAEVVAYDTTVTIRFRDAIPSDLIILMPIPTKAGSVGYWLLYPARDNTPSEPETIIVDLSLCGRYDDKLQPLAQEPADQPVSPHVYVEIRWEGHSATFPVRFDDKARLPVLLVGRKATEGELIEYFLFGTQPEDSDETRGFAGEASEEQGTDAPVDTRRILAYFIRRFVQAIPGIEAEVKRAAYSRASLDAALRGPTSPLELVERAYSSLTISPAKDEPHKTPTAVAFQLSEILAALERCRKDLVDGDLLDCFEPVVRRCRELLDSLIGQHPELQSEAFRRYRSHIVGHAR